MPKFTLDDLAPWIEFRFDRAAGPGGQNVNKVNTRVTLLFDFQHAPFLTTFDKHRIASSLATRLASDGRLRLVAQVERSQAANREAAQERLMELLEKALHREKPRRPTKPTAGSQRRRRDDKRRRGDLKRMRQGPSES